MDERRRVSLRGRKTTTVVVKPAKDGFGLDPESLVQYAVTARVDLILARRWDPVSGWTPLPVPGMRQELASSAGIEDPKLTKLIKRTHLHATPQAERTSDRPAPGRWARSEWRKRRGQSPLSAVSDLEEDLAMFAVRERGVPVDALEASGSLVALWQELLGTGDTAIQADLRSARWLRGLVEAGPQNTAEALVAGEALMALLAHASDQDDAKMLINRHRDAVTRTVRALVTVASKPPGRGSTPAIHLAAQLGSLPIQWDEADTELTVCDLVVEHVRESPVGFRTTRVLNHMLSLSNPTLTRMPQWWSADGKAERTSAWDALLAIGKSDIEHDPYPARSLWVEGLRAARLTMDPAVADDALDLLEERAGDQDRPPRERAYAAYCVYRALHDGDDDDRARLETLLGVLEKVEDDGIAHAVSAIRALLSGDTTDTTLESLLLNHQRVTPGSSIDTFQLTPAVIVVDAVLSGTVKPEPLARTAVKRILADIPTSVRNATVQLIRYSLLSIDGTGRRRAAHTLREGGFARDVVKILVEVSDYPDAPRFLREHAAFLLGFLNEPYAIPFLADVATSEAADESIRHAALWSIGDIAVADETAVTTVLGVLQKPGQPKSIMRASTYALAVLFPEPEEKLTVEARDVLRDLARNNPDRLVADLARWGLVNRSRTAARSAHRHTDELWGITLDLRATLDAALYTTGP